MKLEKVLFYTGIILMCIAIFIFYRAELNGRDLLVSLGLFLVSLSLYGNFLVVSEIKKTSEPKR